MDKELNALRRVAKAAQAYQTQVSQKQTLALQGGSTSKDAPFGTLEIGTAEFELAEALNEWYRTRQKAS